MQESGPSKSLANKLRLFQLLGVIKDVDVYEDIVLIMTSSSPTHAMVFLLCELKQQLRN